MSDSKNYVVALIKKSSEVHDSSDAMKFSQAAANAANAMLTLVAVETNQKRE